MEFLWLGDITLFICFERSSLLASHYLSFLESVCARVEAEEQNVSVAQENNKLIEDIGGELSLHCSSRWSTPHAWLC